jgi:hypothetical protein
LRILVIANGQNDEARLKMARSLDGLDSSGRHGVGQLHFQQRRRGSG